MGVSDQMGKVVLKMAYTAKKSKKVLRYLETNLNVSRGSTMIDKRLFQLVEKKSLVLLILFRVLSLGLMIGLWLVFAQQLTHYLEGQNVDWLWLIGTVLVVLVGKAILTKLAEKQIYQASAELRLSMRRAVMEKAFRLGNNEGQLPASTLTQISR